MNKKSVEKKILIASSVAVLLTLVVGVSYAWWSTRVTQKEINKLNSACLKLELVEETSGIQIDEAYPLTDEEASALTPYTFTIKNVCNTSVLYDVELDIMESKDSEGNDVRLKSEYIAIEFNQEEKRILDTLERTTPSYNGNDYKPVEARKLTSGTLNGGASIQYALKLWIDESVTIEDDAMNKEFISKIVVNGSLNPIVENYKENILNGADPVLGGNLIAVEIDDTGKVTKADVKEKWYSYEEKRWANAIILEDESITYKVGEEIPEENIESYFVWIPKYSYELWDLGEYDSLTEIDESKVHEIPIQFGIEDTSDDNEGECTTPMTSGSSGNCEVGDYMTPPAFITMGTNGLWVGKFESGYKGATSPGESQVNTSESNKLQIKPNVYSWRDIQDSNAHLVSYNYQRELDSHMMKNTEWGAVAYLQHSKYGSSESVRINNNASYITGYAAKSEPTCGYTNTNEECNIFEETELKTDGSYTINYTNPESQVASTTGNYTGIYDMSGGSGEYMMATMLDEMNSIPIVGEIDVSKKYYDEYLYSTSYDNFNRRILGDGTGEVGPFSSQPNQVASWYADEMWFVYSLLPRILRGGFFSYGTGAGIFASIHTSFGYTDSSTSFRVVLAI